MQPMTEAEQIALITEARSAGLAAQQDLRTKIRNGGEDTAALFDQLAKLNGDLRVLEAELSRA